jgi:hypothetical protein
LEDLDEGCRHSLNPWIIRRSATHIE